MSSLRAALIAAIREAPDDDGPRLICADWFEEQGGEANVARAEFIRTQIQRANLPPDDVRQSELEARELRLLKHYAPVWCGSHFVFKKVRFRRGFIEYVHLHLQHFLHHRRQMLDLEPVCDVSLTGWFRAPDDLIRRVAGCEEWKYVETLRIHHQGPHKDPRSNLLDLLESPHLTDLHSLHGTLVQFDADARRRFERLPCLRHVRELIFPTLDFLGEAGPWFLGGGVAAANRWAELRSLTFPRYLRPELSRLFMAIKFWEQLERISLSLPREAGAVLAVLRERLPRSLRQLSLSPEGATDVQLEGPFVEALTALPIQGLHLFRISISPESLRCLLGTKGRAALRELSLSIGRLSTEHVRDLAESPASEGLRSLSLSGNMELDGGMAQRLFSSERLRGLVHLDLSGTNIGAKGVKALARAPGWERLRVLDLRGVGMTELALQTLLASPNVRNLTVLSLGARPAPVITPAIAAEMIRLPHLARLHLRVPRCDPQVRRVFSHNADRAWVLIESDDEEWGDIQKQRAFYSPEKWPPVDEQLNFVEA